jgi:hypothetical protein
MNRDMNYLVWSPSNKTPNSVALDILKGFDSVDRLWRGESLVGEFPDDAVFRMRSEFPENTVLTDSLSNLDSLIIGSQKLKEFLESQDVSNVEYHAVTIRDHKNKVVKSRYYIINPVSNVECLDAAASGAVMSRTNKTKVKFLNKLVLREDAVDQTRKMFRVAHFDMITLVREDLATAIDKAGFTGIRWVETSKYPR